MNLLTFIQKALFIFIRPDTMTVGKEAGYVVGTILVSFTAGGLSVFGLGDNGRYVGPMFAGFCLSMWLLTLKDGGLLQKQSEVAAFILVFTMVPAGIAAWKPLYTRAQLVYIPFSAATAIILGIDCFSRAGLKEFWIWVWGKSSRKHSGARRLTLSEDSTAICFPRTRRPIHSLSRSWWKMHASSLRHFSCSLQTSRSGRQL
jgi:hypothetical protein